MEQVTVYFDYICPYAKRGMELAHRIKDRLQLSFEWKHYSLHQGNYQGSDWLIWDDPIDVPSADDAGLLSFLASYAAIQQADPFDNYRLNLIRARHDERHTITLDRALELAQKAGLDREQFAHDLTSAEARASLAQDHQEAISRNISATPTFCFESGAAAYFRFTSLPEDDNQAVQFFCDYRNIIERYPQLETIRRPYKRR